MSCMILRQLAISVRARIPFLGHQLFSAVPLIPLRAFCEDARIASHQGMGLNARALESHKSMPISNYNLYSDSSPESIHVIRKG